MVGMPTLETELTRRLGIRYPIFSVGFGSSAVAELAAAVSNAGGCGVIGASGAEPDEIRRRIRGTRALTDRPFGVNLIIDEDDEGDREHLTGAVGAICAERVAVLVLFWGDPAPYVDLAHRAGVKVFIQVGSLEEARAAAAAGVDAVIAQGFEAGGHVKGTTSVWELVPAVIEAIAPVPVLASGGIGNGTAIARALELGAQGVSLGTRFVASREAWIHDDFKQRVVEARGEDTVYTEDLYDIGWPDAPHRTLRNRNYEEWDAAGRPPPGRRPGEGTSIGTQVSVTGDEVPLQRYAVGMVQPTFEGQIEYAPMWAGTSVTDVNDIKPAAEIVADLVRETEAASAGDARRMNGGKHV
jgi:nitronate monooxygenase